MKHKIMIPLLTVLVGGCASVPVSQFTHAVGTASANLNTASIEIKLAEPHADQIGQAHLVSAKNAVNTAAQQVPTMEQAAERVGTLQKALQDERDHWLGARARRLLHTILIIAALALVAQIALAAFGVIGPSSIASGISKVLGLVVPFFGGLVTMLHDIFKSKTAKKI